MSLLFLLPASYSGHTGGGTMVLVLVVLWLSPLDWQSSSGGFFFISYDKL